MAEEEFRGVCREAIMANLNSSRPVDLEDLEGEICAMELSSATKRQILDDEKRAVRERRRSDWEVNALRVAPFPPDILGDQTPLVASKIRPPEAPQISRRSPGASRSRVGGSTWHPPAVESPASLLPAPSAAHQMPVPGGDLPSVLLLDGFRIPKLNQAFHFNNQILLCGYPTYWDRDRNYFLYFHSQDQRWVISPRDSLAQAQSGVMLGCAFQYVDDVWNELANEEWQKAPQVRVTPLVEQAPARAPAAAGAQPLPSRSRPPAERASVALPADGTPYAPAAAPKQAFAVDTVHIRGGFLNPKLNAVYHMDSSVQVGSRATYWDEQRRFFMYYQAAMKRWAISIRIHDAKTGEDMLDHARRGGLCGFAFEVDKLTNQWKEFYEGRWVTVQIDIHKLCTGKRAPPVAARTTASFDLPPETPIPMAVKPEPPLPPQPPQPSQPSQPQPPQPPQPPHPPQPIQAPSRAPPAAAAPAVAPVAAPPAPSAPSTVAPSPVAPKTSSEKQMAAPLEREEAQAEDSEAKGEVAKAKEAEAKSSKEIPSEDESHEEKRKKRKKDKDAKNAVEKDNHKADKKAKKLEKEERARRKENKMREKIRQEMLAARANKPSNTKGPTLNKKNSPKKASRKVRDSLKSKERKEAKREKSERSCAPSPEGEPSEPRPSRRRWHAAVAKPWPSLWSEDDAVAAVTSQPPEGATVPQPSQA